MLAASSGSGPVAAPAATRRRIWSTGASARCVMASRSRPSAGGRDLAEPIRAAVDGAARSLDEPTTFEVGTAFAFLHFARQRIDVAVLEVGVGGPIRRDQRGRATGCGHYAHQLRPHADARSDARRRLPTHKAGILRAEPPGHQRHPQPERGSSVDASASADARSARPARDGSCSRRSRSVDGAHRRPACWATTSAITRRRRWPLCTRWVAAGLRSTQYGAGLEAGRVARPPAGARYGAVAGARRRPQCCLGRRLCGSRSDAFRVRSAEAGRSVSGTARTPRACSRRSGRGLERLRLTRSRHERSADPGATCSLWSRGVDARRRCQRRYRARGGAAGSASRGLARMIWCWSPDPCSWSVKRWCGGARHSRR